MKAALQFLVDRLRQFRVVEQGAAAVEFALILPIMLVLYIGSVEASALISMDRRVQQIAGTLGDLVARSDTAISAAILQDYFKAAGGLMTPYQTTDLRQVVSQIQVNADGTTKVIWSKQYLNGVYGQATGTAHATNSTTYKLDDEIKVIAKGSYVIVSEVNYSYLPLYGIIFKQPIMLYRENFFMPRFGGTITVN